MNEKEIIEEATAIQEEPKAFNDVLFDEIVKSITHINQLIENSTNVSDIYRLSEAMAKVIEVAGIVKDVW